MRCTRIRWRLRFRRRDGRVWAASYGCATSALRQVPIFRFIPRVPAALSNSDAPFSPCDYSNIPQSVSVIRVDADFSLFAQLDVSVEEGLAPVPFNHFQKRPFSPSKDVCPRTSSLILQSSALVCRGGPSSPALFPYYASQSSQPRVRSWSNSIDRTTTRSGERYPRFLPGLDPARISRWYSGDLPNLVELGMRTLQNP